MDLLSTLLDRRSPWEERAAAGKGIHGERSFVNPPRVVASRTNSAAASMWKS
jgi:hypothetical protein